ncbi:MAG: SBBP repeat-containing protein, partial [Acidobacteria bacterium]|nr:SBBP repeat-containing protein [Acidobacteriota bacterium]
MPHLAVRGLLLLLPAMAANAADASLLYSTFLGGTAAESAVAVAVDRSGNIYVAGTTHSSDFPVAGSVLPCAAKLGPSDGFVVKLNPSGTSVIYSACLSGSGREAVSALAVDPSGNAYVAGSTNSTDFPVTATAVQPKLAARTDGFVVKLSSTGSIVYSTYIGGNGDDIPIGAAVDSGGQVYLTGLTLSGDLATTKGSVQPVRSDGGDAFVAKLNSTGSAYVYLTFLGGKRIDLGTAIAADKDGNAYVTGFTFSNEFPVTTGAFQTVPA